MKTVRIVLHAFNANGGRNNNIREIATADTAAITSI